MLEILLSRLLVIAPTRTQKLSENEEKFDLIWLGNVLEHVLDPVDLLLKLRRLVTPLSIVIVTVPNDGNEYQEMLLEEGAIAIRF